MRLQPVVQGRMRADEPPIIDQLRLLIEGIGYLPVAIQILLETAQIACYRCSVAGVRVCRVGGAGRVGTGVGCEDVGRVPMVPEPVVERFVVAHIARVIE